MIQPSSPRTSTPRYWPVALAAMCGIGLTLAAFLEVWSWDLERYRFRFESKARQAAVAFERGIAQGMDVLYSVQSAIDATGGLTRAQFSHMALDMLANSPSLQALEWCPRVEEAQRARFERQAREDGFAGFKFTDRDASGRLKERPHGKEFYPVYFVEPMANNREALGFAPLENPRNVAIARALGTSRPVASRRIRLVQDSSARLAVAIFMRVSGPGPRPLGVVEAVFRIPDLIQEAFNGFDLGAMRFRLIDSLAPAGERELYDSGPRAPAIAGGVPLWCPMRQALHWSSPLSVGGERWILEFTPDSAAPGYPRPPWGVLALGLFTTLVAAAYLNGRLGRNQQVERLVTERTAQLARLSDRYRLLLNSVGEGILETDAEGRLMFVNPAASRMLGYASDALLGKFIHQILWLEPHALGSQVWVESPVAESIRLGRAIASDAEHWSRADGSEMPVEYISAPLSEDPAGAVILFRDITERLEVQAERSAAMARQQEMLARLEAAQELDRLKTHFVNGLSHDLRTPLTSIRGYTEFLEEGLAGTLNAEQLHFVGQIEKGSQRLERLVDDLLDFARLEAGTFRLQCEETDLGEVVLGVVESLRPQAAAARLTLEALVPEAAAWGLLDRPRVERVLINLIGNAIKFAPADGRVTVRVLDQSGHLGCEVQDDGPGIALTDQSRLFQRFSQLEAGARRGGTGLGLSIGKAIVEAHGGAIGVRSAPEQGSTFWFTLPQLVEP